MRMLAAALVLVAGTAAYAQQAMSPPLSLAMAAALVQQVVMPGKVFAIEDSRYLVESVAVSQAGQEYTVRIRIRPLYKQ